MIYKLIVGINYDALFSTREGGRKYDWFGPQICNEFFQSVSRIISPRELIHFCVRFGF